MWQRVPFVRLLLPLLLGASLAVAATTWFANMPLTLALGVGAFSLLLLGLLVWRWSYRLRWIGGASLFGLLFLLGLLRCHYYDERLRSDHFSKNLPYLQEDYPPYYSDSLFVGIVENIDEKEKNTIIRLKTEMLGKNSCSGNLLIYLHKQLNKPSTIHYGDRLAIMATLLPLREAGNPDAFEYSRYLHFQNIHYQTFLDSSRFQILAHHKGNPLKALALRLRDDFVQILRCHLGEDKEYGVAAALILGYKNDLDADLTSAYIETGTMHILAVSGMHIGLLYVAMRGFLSLFIKRKQHIPKSLLIIAFIWFFALLTGLGGSILRAAVMFSLLELGRVLNRKADIYNVLAATAFLLIIVNPYTLFDVGFQLSYLAVLGITYFYPRIFRLLYFKNWILRRAWDLTAVGIAAQAVTLPISLYYFHQFPTYFWLGVVAIPLSIIAMYAGILLFALAKINILLAFLPSKILWWSVFLMNKIIYALQDLPFANLKGIWVTATVALGMYAMIGALVLAFRQRRWIWVNVVLGIFCCLLLQYFLERVTHLNRKEIVVYSHRKYEIIDFFDENKKNIYSFRSPHIPKEQLKYTTENHYYRLNANNLKILENTNNYQDNTLKIQYNFFQYIDFQAIIFNAPLDNMKEKSVSLLSIPINAVIITDNPNKFHISTLLSQYNFKPKTVIATANNSRWHCQAWAKECKELNIPFHDIALQGAWVYEFK